MKDRKVERILSDRKARKRKEARCPVPETQEKREGNTRLWIQARALPWKLFDSSFVFLVLSCCCSRYQTNWHCRRHRLRRHSKPIDKSQRSKKQKKRKINLFNPMLIRDSIRKRKPPRLNGTLIL